MVPAERRLLDGECALAAAVRSALTGDHRPSLNPSGLLLRRRLGAIGGGQPKRGILTDLIAPARSLGEDLSMPILPKERDPRLITIRRGGGLTDEDHHLLAEWAALCAEHVLPFFESACPEDTRPRDAIAVGRAWIRGEVRMRDAHRTAFVANAAARGLPDPARFAALAAGQAVAVAHVAAHYLGAAAYAIRAAAASVSAGDAEAARLQELGWQRERIPAPLRELVLQDQRARNDICWGVFTT